MHVYVVGVGVGVAVSVHRVYRAKARMKSCVREEGYVSDGDVGEGWIREEERAAEG